MKFHIKYMVSTRCKMAVKEVLKDLGLHFAIVELGEVEIMENISEEMRAQLKITLSNSGFELMDDKKAILIDKIKNIIIEMVHQSEDIIKINFSNLISRKLNLDYTYLSNLFSAVQGVTIENFIISHKIARIKDLMIYGDLNMTEISLKMNYSSVAHLSNQFKKTTGLTPTQFKELNNTRVDSNKEFGIQKLSESNGTGKHKVTFTHE